MEIEKRTTSSGRERGNALFLILIAVALFAALSYAITQSGRGGGNVSNQTNLITAGQLTEEPADIRAAVSRMIVTGVSPIQVDFTLPAPAAATAVFDQTGVGGGATNIAPPTTACITATDCSTTGWNYINATAGNGIFVAGVGSAGVNGGDAMAVLHGAADTAGTNGVTEAVCEAIQKGLGFTSTTPPTGTGGPVLWGTPSTYLLAGNGATISAGATGGVLLGQDFACFMNTTGAYDYYAVLIDQ